MAVAERFSKTTLMSNLTSTQMIQLLSLPSAEETEKFIEQKAAEGKAVADMTIKELREEIADYKKAVDSSCACCQTFSKVSTNKLAELFCWSTSLNAP